MLLQFWGAPVRRRIVFVLAGLLGGAAVVAQELPTIRHRPIQYFVPGHRVEVLAAVSDESGVDTVRCYFRQEGAVEYSYVDMAPVGGDQYRGVLPAPSDENSEIEYMFLLVTGAGCLFRTDPFVVRAGDEREQAKGAPQWQQVAENEAVAVGTDLETTLAGIPGFDDAIELAAAVPEERYGITGGVYGEPDDDDQGAGGALLPGPAGVIFCGVIPAATIVAAASTGGAGGGLAAGVGVAAAAAGGVVAATNDGGGSSGGGGSLDPPVECTSSTSPILFSASGGESLGTPAGDPWTTVIPLPVGPSPELPIVVFANILGDAGPVCECFGDNIFQVFYDGVLIADTGNVSQGQTGTGSGSSSGSATEVIVEVLSCNEGCDEENGHSWTVDIEVSCGSLG